MSLMTEAIERINTYCHLKEPDKSREEVEKQLSFFPFHLADEVYEYYQWRGTPTGDDRPDDWDGPYNNSSTYYFSLEHFLGCASDLIHFLSLEEAEKFYPNYPNNRDINELKGLPFVCYENGNLVIAGSETQVETSSVLQREGCDTLWFPSLTNMMLAIADSLEEIGTIMPGLTCDENGDWLDKEEVQEQWNKLEAIVKKHGSSHSLIVTN